MKKTLIFSTLFFIGFLGVVFLYNFDGSEKFPHLSKPIMVVAGVPKDFAETKDYDAIFRELKRAGVDGFFPLFLYEEVPVPKTTGNELDFLLPCHSGTPAFTVMRAHNVKYLVPGEILYASDNFPPLLEDPLKRLIDCAGRDTILGVTSYDEPFFRGITPEQTEKLYRRVKEVDPTIPVFLVHAPLPAVIIEDNTSRPITTNEASFYFSEIRRYTKYADILGFDVYPIPQRIAQTVTPYRLKETPDYRIAIADYLRWLKENSDGKPYFIALQAFSYRNLGPSWLNTSTDDAPWPTKEELREMIQVVTIEQASYIIWFGPSYLKTAQDKLFWQQFLEALRNPVP